MNLKNIMLMSLMALTFMACNADIGSETLADKPNIGKGGSTTRFAIVDNYLYVVEKSSLKTFDLSDTSNPELIDTLAINDELETIFPYEYENQDVLLLGAREGMHVFKITEDGTPDNGEQIVLAHINSCDPVVANNGYAYVTLRSDNFWCSQGFNELHVNDISDINNPRKEGPSIPMQGPKGLSLSADGSALLVCDKDALVVFSLEDPSRPFEEGRDQRIQCNDILEFEDHYIVTGDHLLKIYSFDPMTYELTFEINLY